MTTDVESLLRDRFQLSTFKPGQQAVIENLLSGRSSAAVFPTGGGKSLCYQLPALAFEGLTLVVSPLIALMKDQIDRLTARGIAARRLDSTLTIDEVRQTMDEVRGGRLKLLYIAPERFNNERFRQSMRNVRVSLFAIDEAHCISEWGHNFRPDYLKLPQIARDMAAERVLALTATATGKVLSDICREFRIDTQCAIRTPFYRSNLTLLTTPTTIAQRDALLLDRLRTRPPGATIIYVTLQATAEELAKKLDRTGLAGRAYHAGMEDDDRSRVQDWFMASSHGIIVATIAFGMGVDKRDIRYIYHFNPPKSLENYSQEIGRAGRDGEPSTCELLYCTDDLNVLQNFVYGDTPARDAVRSFVREVLSLGDQFDVSTYELSNTHDIRLLVVRTLLTYLELTGYLEGGTPFYSTYQFKPLQSSKEILARFQGERREFLAKVFQQTVKARTWFKIDVDAAARNINTDRDRIIRALDYLAEQGLLELKTEGVRLRYRRLKMPPELDALADKLFDRAVAREQNELARLDDVVSLVTHPGCQVSRLGAHFGEPLADPCGHCSSCQRTTTQPAQSSPASAKSSDVAGDGKAAPYRQPTNCPRQSTPASGGAWISSNRRMLMRSARRCRSPACSAA